MNILQVIQRGAAESARRERTLPFLLRSPPLAARIAGRFVVGCESDDCAVGPQVAAANMEDVWNCWNRRAG